MTLSKIPHPPVASRDQWLAERKKLLAHELEAYSAQEGWSVSWFSSFGSEFNYDFHVTNDEKVAPIEYMPSAEIALFLTRPLTTPVRIRPCCVW